MLLMSYVIRVLGTRNPKLSVHIPQNGQIFLSNIERKLPRVMFLTILNLQNIVKWSRSGDNGQSQKRYFPDSSRTITNLYTPVDKMISDYFPIKIKGKGADPLNYRLKDDVYSE